MPEPERDIEKTLRAYAKKRREEAGAPAEMHPATRKLLQGEVARLRGKPQNNPGFWAKVLGASWPQIAFRVSVFVLLASMMCLLLLPSISRSKSRAQFAKLRLREEQARVLKKETDLDEAQRYDSPAEEPAHRRMADGTLGGQLSLKQDRPAGGAVVINGKEPAFKNGRGGAGELTFPNGTSTPASGQEKDKLSASSAIPAEKISPEPAQVASGTFALDGLATNAAAIRPNNTEDVIKREKSGYTSAPTVAASAPAARAAVRRQTVESVLADSAAVQPATPPPPAAVFSSGSLAAADRESFGNRLDSSKAVANSITQQFARTDEPANMQKALRKANQAVLRSFRVEQSSNQIRMIDKDGSIYSGYLGQAAEGTKPVDKVAETKTVQSAAKSNIQTRQNDSLSIGGGGGGGVFQPAQNVFFRVSGTNRSLKQLVVFTGSFVPNIQIQPGFKLHANAGLVENQSPTPMASPSPLQLFNSQLQGRAVIGNTNQLEILALPVKP